MSSSNCCFLTCIQVTQEASQVVWYAHLFQNFLQFIVIHIVKSFGIVNKAEIDVFLEFSCFFNDPTDVGNLISGSSAFSKTSLNIWKFMVCVLLEPGLENIEHYLLLAYWVHTISMYEYIPFLFLSTYHFIRSIPFLSFIVPIFAWNIPLLSLIFLKRSLVLPILLFSSTSLHWSLRKAFLSLLAILWNSAFKWVYLSFSPLPLASHLFSAICKASSVNHFAFLHLFFLGMVLITAFCTMSRISVHSSSGSLSGLIPWIYLSLPLYNRKGFDLGHTWMV